MQNPHWAAEVSRNAAAAAQLAVHREPFDGRDPDTVHLGSEDEAGVDAAVVDQDRAGAALADEAALLRPGQAEVRAEHVEQRVMGFDGDRALAPIDDELDRDAVGDHAADSARRRCAVSIARSPSTRSIARRYSGLARIEVGDGAAAEQPSSTARRASADERGRQACRSRRSRATAVVRHSRRPAVTGTPAAPRRRA